MYNPKNIRNIAIIAHIDHGKTTLLDGILKQSNIFRDNQVVRERMMDSYSQEQERGITIFSKHTSIFYGDYKINIIDTPGHADFSAEVERILGMVNCVLLIVDAQDGPMPQTRFVLSKSLKMGLSPIVFLNKIDRPSADPDRVLNETFDLFVELGAHDEQLDFKYCYGSGLNGFAMRSMSDPRENFNPLLDLIIEAAPPPEGSLDNPFLMQSATISYDDFVGRQACGRIQEGIIRKGEAVIHINEAGKQTTHSITRIEGYHGLVKVEMEEAGVGDIVSLSGIPDVTIGDTLSSPTKIIQLPPIHIDEPTVSVDMQVNSGPFVGKSGKHVTMNKIRDRLQKEQRGNISYKIIEDPTNLHKITVAGRGELHLAIFFEALRREGFEFCISKPQVILKQVDNVKMEPMSKVYIEVPKEYSGSVIEQLSSRKGEMTHLLVDEQNITHIEFNVPTRGLFGYRNEFLTTTRGLGILTSVFDSYQAYKGDIVERTRGVLIANCGGKAKGYACMNLESRGDLFVSPGEEVYEGMIVGEHSRDNDLVVNITTEKKLTNMRASGNDENVMLQPPRQFTLEQAIGYINNDELIEVTPDAIRLRKGYLNETERNRYKRK